MEELRCYGCGAIIQSEDEKKIGFVPKNALDRSQVLCKRCFRLKNYHQLQATNLSDDDFLEILNKIGEKDCLVVYLVDLFDFNGSLIQGLVRHINYNDVIVVGNKRDILPRSIKDTKIIHWLRRQLKLEGIKPLDVLLTSGKKNYHLDELMQMIDQYRKGRDVYVVGVTNVGKSSLINSLLKAYSDVQDNLITTSEFPGTTLDLIEIPLDENRVYSNLEVGNPIICSVGPGDFTTEGHFIVLAGLEDGKIIVNDPNSRKNSKKRWTFDEIKGQIKNLWVFR